MYKGIEASRGIGIGSICLIVEHDLSFESKHIEDTEAEKARFNSAIETFKTETAAMADNIRKNIGPKEAEIMEGHLAMIADPTMAGEMTKMIDAGQCAEAAVTAVCDMFIGMFSKMEDDMMRQRASDISDIKVSLLKLLLGIEDVDISAVAPGTVLVAHDLTPSMTSQIVKENVVGIITEVGGKTSHSAILARALEIPAVLSVPNITELVKDKDTAIVDGTEGEVYINPDGEKISQYVIKREEFIKAQAELKNFIGKETVTADGTPVELFCNIGTPKDAKKAIECDGEGIGLFRSEFLFMDRPHLPTEDEQFAIYKQVAQTLAGKKVIIRTLDIGADKQADYFELPKEENPAMGLRAIRICLTRPEVFKTQLRAILRASAFGKISIMFPMIISVDEVKKIKSIVEEVKKELDSDGLAYDKDIELGIMIETPAAVMIADELAEEVDFFSVGTNDLTQYTLAIDRQNQSLDEFYDSHHPAIMRMLAMIADAAHRHGAWAGICGELGADLSLTKEFLAMGYDELSVSPGRILPIRKTVLETNVSEYKKSKQ